VSLGEPITIGDRVAVVGGGITALDATAVARRLGARQVYLILDRPRGELPAYHWEMAAVESEGIVLHEHTTAIRILSDDGRVAGVELARTGKGFSVDDKGRHRPTIEAGTEFTLEVDTVIGTVGQQSDLTFLDPIFDDLSGDPNTLGSAVPGLFVVGGRKTGATYIIEAVALGHRVALSIDRHLRGVPLEGPRTASPPALKFSKDEVAGRLRRGEIRIMARVEPALLPLEERVSSFREVVLGLNDHQARTEARRCLQCGLCSECLACVYACGASAIDHNMTEHLETIRVGAVVLAPGYQTYQAELSQEFGVGRIPDVVTSLQFERLLSASGPTAGHITRPSNGQPARRIAFLQCIGSRDQGHDYCSAVCCMAATKEAILAREHAPETEVHVFMMDMRAFSKGYEAYYRRARNQYGIQYTRCRVSSLREEPETGDIIVRYSSDLGSESGDSVPPDRGSPFAAHPPRIREEGFDLVVLSVGMEISEPVRKLARDLAIEVDDYGFCHTAFFNPLESSRPGIYVAGPFREPKDIPESVIDASGTAGSAAALLAGSRGLLARPVSYPPEREVGDEDPRVGVFVCHCGSNIAGFLDVEAVTAYAARLPGVVHADHLLYACSQDSTATIQRRISEERLNRVVVASCTPLTHAPLFQDCLRQAGLNEHLFAMANIRNHCSWVHSEDRALATFKAKELVRMAVARVGSLEPLRKEPAPVNKAALIIGGGPAGMTAAINLADQGFAIHLVERDDELGGHLRQLRTTLPTFDGSPGPDPRTFLDKLRSEVAARPGIVTHLATEVSEVQGFVGSFRSRLTRRDGASRVVENGVILVATGGQQFRGPEYGYGSDGRVLSQQEFEELLADRPASLPSAPRLVMIQCVGPAETSCGRLCCATALKNALLLKEVRPDAQVVVLYRDMRTYGFKERLYTQARERGVVFLRYDDDHRPRVDIRSADDPLHVQAWDLSLNVALDLATDLVVLAMPLVPSEGSRALGKTLKVPVDQDGWFLEAHVKLRPVEFASSGIYLAGAAHYPKLLDETIVQAQAAAARAATVLSQPSLSAGGVVARVDPQRCVGCLTCVRLCPFGVPKVNPGFQGVGGLTGAAYIEPAICQGCGICVGECPSNAIELLHYRRHQMERQVLALLEPVTVSVSGGSEA
jgi:heterodisulfide reductase subunit A-like polyferredoxin